MRTEFNIKLIRKNKYLYDKYQPQSDAAKFI